MTREKHFWEVHDSSDIPDRLMKTLPLGSCIVIEGQEPVVERILGQVALSKGAIKAVVPNTTFLTRLEALVTGKSKTKIIHDPRAPLLILDKNKMTLCLKSKLHGLHRFDRCLTNADSKALEWAEELFGHLSATYSKA